MLQSFIDFIGSYTPVMTNVYDDSGQLVGQVVASGAAGVDWQWVASATFAILIIWSLIRIVGRMICRD